jgi:hypothetical protein
LSIDNVVINADDPKAITGRVMQNSSVFTKSNYYKLYYTLNGTGSEQSITSTDGTFTISLDIVKNAISSLEIYLRDSKGNLYDKESIGVVKNGIDGVNAQYYQIDANHILITKDSKGNVISPSEAITPKVCYINGAAKEDQDYNSLINEGYYIWKKLNGGTATKISNSTSLSTACSLVNTQLVYYLCKKTVTSNPETQFEDYVEIDVIQTEPEKSGPVIYPAGEWTSGTTYTGNVQKAPYVSVTDGDNVSYYIAYGSLSAKPTSDNTLASNVTLD